MIDEQHVNDAWECPSCDEDGMTEQEFTRHKVQKHPEEDPFEGFYPDYNVCGDPDGGDDYVNVYMLAVTECGPFYMAWDDRDYVEVMPPLELMRHDWQPIERENTPFPKFEK